MVWRVGNDLNVNVWKDKWVLGLGGCVLCESEPETIDHFTALMLMGCGRMSWVWLFSRVKTEKQGWVPSKNASGMVMDGLAKVVFASNGFMGDLEMFGAAGSRFAPEELLIESFLLAGL
ncbi:uncharacterized protein G2W53_020111 [Senna tora]|uniref:Uncharacterized protein n=1 Tax=Senna tora TaxID=362788 RepID=A0A834TVH3_9FABA|nr:uncharacterized protein G2W53_020111 [Senna tora]